MEGLAARRNVGALIVDHDGAASADLAPALRRVGVDHIFVERGAPPAGIEDRVDVAFVDSRVGVATSLELARELQARVPGARLVVLGYEAPASYVFKLAMAGASGYLEPPFADSDLRDCVSTNEASRRLGRAASCLVGLMSLKDAQTHVRTIMLQQALATTGGSRRSAARILGVTRPAVQRMLREVDAEAAAKRRQR